MTLSEQQLADDLKRAMKARDATTVLVLRGVTAAAKNLKVEKRVAELSPGELTEVVRRELRKRIEAEEFAANAGRDDLVRQNASERAVLEPYLPAMLSAAELEECVREILATQPGAAMGAVMGALRNAHAGRFDGREASELVRRLLAEARAE